MVSDLQSLRCEGANGSRITYHPPAPPGRYAQSPSYAHPISVEYPYTACIAQSAPTGFAASSTELADNHGRSRLGPYVGRGRGEEGGQHGSCGRDGGCEGFKWEGKGCRGQGKELEDRGCESTRILLRSECSPVPLTVGVSY